MARGTGSTRRRVAVALMVAAGMTAAVPSAASATNPGRNGVIAFESIVDGTGEVIHTVEPDGSARRALVYDVGYAPTQPAFSPTGGGLAYRAFCGGQCSYGIFTSTPGSDGLLGRDQRYWAGGPNPSTDGYPPSATSRNNPSWSPDGGRLVYDKEGSLYVTTAPKIDEFGNATRSEERRLTLGPADSQPAWSPDGREIAFTRCSAPGKCGIHAISPSAAAGSPTRAVTDDRNDHHDPNWAPDSGRIAFEIGTSRGAGKGIWTIRRDGRDWRQVHGSGYEPAYSPDGTRIVLTKRSGVYTVRVDGSALREIARGADLKNPDWQPLR